MMTPDSFRGPRHFARYMLAGDRLTLRPLADQLLAFQGRTIEAVLFRDGCWQVELIAALPNAVADRHRHMRCASADLLLNGDVRASVEGRSLRRGVHRGALTTQLNTVGRGEWHNGVAGESGLIYLSFQQWDGEPGFISEDWEAWKP